MHLPTSIRDRSFYAKFYSRPPSEIEIIDKTPSSTSYVLRTLSESPTTITPLSDVLSSGTSGFLSSSDCSSSESTSSYTKRRRTTAPIIQERLNTYESACARPSLPLPSLNISKQKTQSNSTLCSPSLVNQLIIPQQIPAEQTTKSSLINTTSNLIDNQISRSVINIQDDSLFHSNINEKSILFDSSKRYLSKSTSQLCDQSLDSTNKEEEDEIFSTSRNILDVIQEELSEIRRADNDLKKMFISIYDKIQNIQQLKSTSTTIHPQHKGQRYHYHHNERPSRLIAHCCHSSNSDIRRMSCTHHHHNRKYSYHTAVALRNRMNNLRTSSTADNDSYVDTDSSSSSSDSGTCSSPVDNGPCSDD